MSKAPKVTIYQGEEKRIQQTYGEKSKLTYKIKLNDEVLDKNSKSVSKGKLMLGALCGSEVNIK